VRGYFTLGRRIDPGNVHKRFDHEDTKNTKINTKEMKIEFYVFGILPGAGL
jgi:hypothetical protein